MTNGTRLLVVSNGHGEDQIARRVCDAILGIYPQIQVSAVPLVGLGDAFKDANGIHCVPGTAPLPSGGFLRSVSTIIKDLGSGLIAQHQDRRDVIRELLADKFDIVLAVGDIYALWMASGAYIRLGGTGMGDDNDIQHSGSLLSQLQHRAMHFMSKIDKKHSGFLDGGIQTKNPLIFMPTAKSDRFMPHSRLERQIIKRLALVTITRDPETAEGLTGHGLHAVYGGNPMFDGLLDGRKMPVKRRSGPLKLGILPGSRDEALGNLQLIADLLNRTRVKTQITVALAPTIDFPALRAHFRDSLWVAYDDRLQHSRSGLQLLFSRDFLGVLYASDLIIGLAGTANEQAATLRKRVICFKGTGPQSSKKRFIEQSKLMGERILFLDQTGEALFLALNAILEEPTPHYLPQPRSLKDAAPTVATLILKETGLID